MIIAISTPFNVIFSNLHCPVFYPFVNVTGEDKRFLLPKERRNCIEYSTNWVETRRLTTPLQTPSLKPFGFLAIQRYVL